MHALYAIGSYLAALLLLPMLLFHPKLRHGIRERLGFYRVPGGPGEGLAAHLAPRRQRRRPALAPAHDARAEGARPGVLPGRHHHHQQRPGDGAGQDPRGRRRRLRARTTSRARPARAMAALRPDLLVLEYTEIWPNLIRAARKAGVRIALTNGRFAPEKLSRYRTFFRVVGKPLRSITLFLMRSDEEAERALQLGAPPDRVWVTGNTKFDALVLDRPRGDDEALRAALALDPGRPVFIAGSTHDGEEELLVEVYRKLPADFPGLQMVVAPRYVERAGKIVSIAQEAGLTARLRSAGAAAGTGPGRGARHHRRAGRRLPAGDAGLRGGQLRPPRGAERPRAGRAGEAGPLRAAHGELQGQRAGAGGARRPPGGDARAAPQGGRASSSPAPTRSCGSAPWRARRWARCGGPARETWTTCCGRSPGRRGRSERGGWSRPAGAALVEPAPVRGRPAARGAAPPRRGALPGWSGCPGRAPRRRGPVLHAGHGAGDLGGQPGRGRRRQDPGGAGHRREAPRGRAQARGALARVRRDPWRRPGRVGRGAGAARRRRRRGRAGPAGAAAAGAPGAVRAGSGAPRAGRRGGGRGRAPARRRIPAPAAAPRPRRGGPRRLEPLGERPLPAVRTEPGAQVGALAGRGSSG